MDTESLFRLFDSLSISYDYYEHGPVYTSDQARLLIPKLPGTSAKNLFLKDKKGTQFYLLSLVDTKTADLKALAGQLGISKLSLASPERLMEYLGVKPGAVSLLALVNDTNNKINLLVDQDLWDADQLQSHPLVNTATVVISHQDLVKLLKTTGHKEILIRIDPR